MRPDATERRLSRTVRRLPPGRGNDANALADRAAAWGFAMFDEIGRALGRLANALSEPAAHMAAWREHGRLEQGELGAWVGRPSAAAVDALDRRQREMPGPPPRPRPRRP